MPNCQTCGKEGIWFSKDWDCKKCYEEKNGIVPETRSYPEPEPEPEPVEEE